MSHPQARRQTVEQRVEEILMKAIETYSDRLYSSRNDAAGPDVKEFREVLKICHERAMRAFGERRKTFQSDDAVFDHWKVREDARTNQKITNPLQDLVHCELVMRHDEQAVSEFLTRYRGLAASKLRKIESMGYASGHLGFSAENAIEEIVTQAVMHDSRHQFRRRPECNSSQQLAEQPDLGKHHGELDEMLPLTGFPLRSYGGRTPLFNWLCTIIPNWLREQLTVRLRPSAETLGWGTIYEGQHHLQLTQGTLKESEHLWARVRIPGAGRSGQRNGRKTVTSLETRLRAIKSESAAMTEKPALRTVAVPGEIKLVLTAQRYQQLSESDDQELAARGQQRERLSYGLAKIRQLLHELLAPGKCLKPVEFDFLKRCAHEKQKDIAASLGKEEYWVSREKTRILEKLKGDFVGAGEDQTDQDVLLCFQLIFRKNDVASFWHLIASQLKPDPLLSQLEEASEQPTSERIVPNLSDASITTVQEQSSDDFPHRISRKSSAGRSSLETEQ
jgi:hypothetical protein